ncbi:putative spermidine/putrescine transport system permease protein [Humitalea rosea]|uniref:Putative spermidine/putrescine transport system permease protein n=1 Tax=Humitalea rosea TaxID=990373 RepID=A0A2W7IR25_9PROT|nr:ABC transporter permease [Humitalea rosea]PZW48421.1 putative spermidine/putrescine transport system permease protein [Humitalea rosea]
MPGRLGRMLLTVLFVAFVLFLYGPTLTIIVLSFQGENGGLTFPMNGVSVHWFGRLFEQQAVGDFGASISRSLLLAAMVTATTVVVSLAAGMAFRRRFPGSAWLFYLTIASLILPSLLVGLGIGLAFNRAEIDTNWWSSAFGAQLTWTLPFGLLIMLAVFNRFDRAWEEAARDLGASPWKSFWHVVLPIVAPSVIGIALFGFTLSFDEFARTLLTAGVDNTLPLEILGMTTTVTTPVLYALGTASTALSFAVIGVALLALWRAKARREAR